MSAPLVLIGAWGLTSAIWAPMRSALGEGIDTRTTDLPGHHSNTARPSATLDGWVDAVCAQLPAKAIVCSASLGALIAMQLALREPARVVKLILIGASPCPVQRDDWRDALTAAHVARLQCDFAAAPAQARRQYLTQHAQGDALHVDVEQALDHARAVITDRNRAVMADGLEILATCDLRAELGALACPVRLLHGANDALVPVGAARWLAETLPEARLSTFDDAGHLPFVSRPTHCATLIRAYIDG